MKSICPYCGSKEVENYGIINTANAMHELEFRGIMVSCMNMHIYVIDEDKNIIKKEDFKR